MLLLPLLLALVVGDGGRSVRPELRGSSSSSSSAGTSTGIGVSAAFFHPKVDRNEDSRLGSAARCSSARHRSPRPRPRPSPHAATAGFAAVLKNILVVVVVCVPQNQFLRTRGVDAALLLLLFRVLARARVSPGVAVVEAASTRCCLGTTAKRP